MHATRKFDALFAGLAGPTVAAIALVRPRAISLVLVATWRAYWLETVGARPAGQANNITLLRAVVVAIDVVARPAEDVALVAKVVWLTGNPVGVGERRCIGLVKAVGPLVLDRQPSVG